MNKPIIIICAGTLASAQMLAQKIANMEIDVEDLISGSLQKENKTAEQLTTEIVDAALSQFIEKLNKAEKKAGRCSLFRRCEDFLQQDRVLALQLSQMINTCNANGIDIENMLDEYELSFLPSLL